MALFAGTRPEQIKLEPVYQALRCPKTFYVLGQQKDLLLPGDHYVRVPITRMSGTLNELLSVELTALEELPWLEYGLVIVQGDTTTALAAAIAAFHHQVPVAHVEAGLRSGRTYVPFPEEMNRRLISELATHHFVPTSDNLYSLAGSGRLTHVVGQTGIDAFHTALEQPVSDRVAAIADWANNRSMVLITHHRRESAHLTKHLVDAVAKIDPAFAIVWPQHPARNIARFNTFASSSVWMGPALTHAELARLITWSKVVVTDSGGVSEEACEAEKPCIILRSRTERQEVLDQGCWLYFDDDFKQLPAQIKKAAAWGAKWCRNSRGRLGDGQSGPRIARIIEKALKAPYGEFDFD